MKTVILYDSSDLMAGEAYATLVSVCQEKSMDLQTVDVNKETVKACIGCFGCWIKTPGVCIHTKDIGNELLFKIFDSCFFVIISKITWGGYSTKVKFYVDRLLPLLHPYFVKKNGEMHHKLRYGKMPALLTIGTSGTTTESQEETFRRYTEAHRDNMGDTKKRSAFIWKEKNGIEHNILSDACVNWFSREISK